MPATKNDTLVLSEAAEVLKMHPDTVKKHAENNEIPGRKIGRNWRFSRRALEAYLAGKVEVAA